MMERCLARIEMSPQGGEGCARHAVAYASAQSLETVPPAFYSEQSQHYLWSGFVVYGHKETTPRHSAVWGAERPGGGLGAPQEVVRLG